MNEDEMEIIEETMRYLGWRGQERDENLLAEIADAVRECGELATPMSFWRTFELDGRLLSGTTLELTGSSMAQLLRGATTVALMACTLGHRLDASIHRYGKTNVSRSVLLDAAASATIEAKCDRTEGEIRAWAAKKALTARPRFSPGYGDLPLELQPIILRLLDSERRLGLSCTKENILLPRKSVTAIVAILPEGLPEQTPKQSCRDCKNIIDCPHTSCIRRS